MSEFLVKHLNHGNLPLGELKPENLTYGFTLNEPGTIAYEIDLSNKMADPIYTAPYATDFVLYRDEIPIMGGMHTEVSVDDVTSNKLNVAGKDWLHYLEKRQWPFDPNNPTANLYLRFQTDVFVVVQDLINTIMAQSDSLQYTMQFAVIDFGAIDGQPVFSPNAPTQSISNELVNYQIDPADTEFILSKIQTLARNNPGFDYSVSWDKIISFYAPKMGFTSNFVLEQDINCSQPSFTDQGPGATYLLGQGTALGVRTGKIYVDTAARDMYRRLDNSVDFGDLSDGSLINNLTIAEGRRQALPIQTFSTKWMSGDSFWDSLSLGDMPRYKGNSGYVQVDNHFRIIGLQATVTDEGDEEVDITFDDGSLSL